MIQANQSTKGCTEILYRLYKELPSEFIEKYSEPGANPQQAIAVIAKEIPGLTEVQLNAITLMFDHMTKINHSQATIADHFFSSFVKDDGRHGLIYEIIEDKKEFIEFLLARYSLVEVHWLEQYIDKMVEPYSLRSAPFEVRFKCECNNFYKAAANNIDLRDTILCCTQCGRSSKTWKVVSGNVNYLIKTTPQKFLGIKIAPKVEEWSVGFRQSKYKQYDKRATKYQDLTKETE